MRPRDTQYRLAQKPGEFRLCHTLAKKMRMNEHIAYCPPTVMAQRDGRVIGLLASYRRRGHLIAGPLISPSPFVTMRLLEIYETAVKEAGHRYYIFAIPKTRSVYVQEVKKLFCLEPAAEDEDSVWFRRVLC